MPELSSTFLKYFILIVVLSCFFMACRWERGKDYRTWEVYRGDEGSNAYSQLNQINKGNVNQIKVAWTYNTSDKSEYFSLESSPIIINNILYGISPGLKSFALDAKTGIQLWLGHIECSCPEFRRIDLENYIGSISGTGGNGCSQLGYTVIWRWNHNCGKFNC